MEKLHSHITLFLEKQDVKTTHLAELTKKLGLFCKTITTKIEELEKTHSRAEILEKINLLRSIIRESPLIRRTQDWPRKYQGDFETIERIIQCKNTAKPYTWGYVFEDYFLYAPISQQHRNKVKKQQAEISSVIKKNPAARILSIGCGTSEDVYQTQTEIKNSTAQIHLIDIDYDALHYSKEKLKTIQDQLTIQQGNIYKILHQISQQYDLILIGGVFDYVSDKFITAILKKLIKSNLSKNGKIIFTNIAEGNPFRIPLEYFFNWFLIERSQKQLHSILEKAQVPLHAITIEKEETGLTYIVTIGDKNSGFSESIVNKNNVCVEMQSGRC